MKYTLKCVDDEVYKKPKRYKLRSINDVNTKRFQLKPKYKKIKEEILEKAIEAIDNAYSYTSGCGYPTSQDYSEVNYVLGQLGKESWIKLIEFYNEKIIDIRFNDKFTTLIIESFHNNQNRFIIFEDKDGKTYSEPKKRKNENISIKIGRKSTKKNRRKGKTT